MVRGCGLLLFDALLAALAIEDYKERKIKNGYPLAILVLSLLTMTVFPEISPGSRIVGMFAGSVPMALLALLAAGSFGGGDVKLVFACGAFLGRRLLLKGMVLAIFFAGIYSLWLILIKKEGKNVQFALGPFLSAGFILSSFTLF